MFPSRWTKDSAPESGAVLALLHSANVVPEEGNMQVTRKAATGRSIEITVKIEAPKPTSEGDDLDLEVSFVAFELAKLLHEGFEIVLSKALAKRRSVEK
jgi:hypothetical protein